MSNFNHLYGAISIWIAGEDKRPASTMWDYERVKRAFHNKEQIKIGDHLPDDQGVDYVVTDISLRVLPELNENKYGIDFSQTGESNVNNIVIDITLKKV